MMVPWFRASIGRDSCVVGMPSTPIVGRDRMETKVDNLQHSF